MPAQPESADGEKALRSRARARAFRLGLVLATTLALILGARSAALAYADDRVRDELRALGLSEAQLTVESVGFDALVLSDVRLGRDLFVRRVEVRYAADELLDGQVDRVILDGARWQVPASEAALRRSALWRLIDACLNPAPGALSGPAPTIELRDAHAQIAEHPAEHPALRIDGVYRPESGRGRFEARSSLGRHTLSIRCRQDGSDDLVALRARSHGAASGDSGDEASLRARIADDGDVEVQLGARLAAIDHVVGGRRLAGRSLAARIDASLRGGIIDALDAEATAAEAWVDDVALSRIDARATSEGDVIAWSASAGPEEALSVSVRGKLPVDPRRWAQDSRPIAWRLNGPVPLRVLARHAPFAVEGPDPLVTSEGELRRDDDGALVGVGWVDARFETLRVERAQLRGVRLALRGRGGALGDGSFVSLGDGSRVTVAHLRRGSLVAADVELTPAVRLEIDGGAARLTGERIVARAAHAWLGRGDRAVRADDLRMTATPRDGRPLLATGLAADAAPTRIDTQLRARARRIDGALEGSRIRADAPLELALRPDGADGRTRVRATAAQIRDPEGWLALTDARLALPLVFDAGDARGRGRLRSGSLAVRGHAFGATGGSLALGAAGATLRLDAPLSDAQIGRVAVRLGRRGESVDVEVPRVRLAHGGPLSELLRDLTGVRITGLASGAVHAPLDDAGRGTARLALDGATVERDGTKAEGARGVLEFVRLEPLASAGPSPVAWTDLRVADLDIGDRGSARLRIRSGGRFEVDRFETDAAGGRIRLAPFTYDPARPRLSLHVTARGLDVGEILADLTEGRGAGRGKLDGEVALEIDETSRHPVRIGSGRVTARGPGHFHFGDAEVLREVADWARPLDGTLIVRRVLGALRDFDYARLEIDLRPSAARPVVARVVGSGRTVRQDVDLTLRLNGLQRLLDETLRIRDAGAAGVRSEGS